MRRFLALLAIVALVLTIPTFSVSAYAPGEVTWYSCYTYFPVYYPVSPYDGSYWHQDLHWEDFYDAQDGTHANGELDTCNQDSNRVYGPIKSEMDAWCDSVGPGANNFIFAGSVVTVPNTCSVPITAFSGSAVTVLPDAANANRHYHHGVWTWGEAWLTSDRGVTTGVHYWKLCNGDWSLGTWNVDFPC